MLKIGDFSKLSRISIRMLRYYDENDVLKPAMIDEHSGYRFYDQEQLYWAFQINFLRETGFSTAMIKEILAHFHDVEEIGHYLHTRLCELEEEKVSMEKMIHRLKKAEELLAKEDMFMKYEVSVKEIPAIDVVSTRDIIPTYEREDLLWKRLMSEISERHLEISYSDEKSRSYFFDEGFKDHDVDVEVCIGVHTLEKDVEDIKFKHLPAHTCACATFQGSYQQITDVCITIGSWINEHDYELDGPNFCIYHIGYSETRDANDFLTEICYPIKKK